VGRIFGPKMKKKETKQCRKLLNNAILVFCPSTNIRFVNPWRKRMGGACDKYRGRADVRIGLLIRKREGKTQLERSRRRREEVYFCIIHPDVVCLIKKL
jgi:hypothetical protein